MECTRQEIIQELWREYDVRRRVYPKLVAKKRLSQEKADRRILEMKSAALLLEKKGGPCSWEDAIAELHRELRTREHSYPGWLQEGRWFDGKKFTVEQANRQLGLIKEAIRLLQVEMPGEPAGTTIEQGDLFGGAV